MEPKPILDALISLPKLFVAKVSHDGRKVAWTWAQVGPTADVFYAPTDGSSVPIRLTNTEQDTWVVSWTPDSQGLIVAQDKDGNERNQVFRLHLDKPGDMEPLTEADPKFFLRGGLLHPNERWFFYAANYDASRDEEIEPSWVYRQDLKTGERVPIARPEKPAYLFPLLNQQGTHLLYNRKDVHPSGRQIWLVENNGENDREVLNFGDANKVFASWFPDGENVLVLAEQETHRRIGVWNRISDNLRWLVDNPSRNFELVFVPKNSSQIVAIEVQDARLSASLIDSTSGDEWMVPKTPHNLIPLAPVDQAAPFGEWIAKIYNSKQPVDLVRTSLSDPKSEKFISLTRMWERTTIQPPDLTEAEDFRWLSTDKLEIQGWLYRCSTPPKGTIVNVHGGPTYHSEDIVDVQIQFLASQGFNVLTPNYRGSTGFGMSFQESIKQDGWGGREQEDIAAGIQALIDRGVAKPGKIGITGTSYGGYSAWFAITRYPADLVSAAAPICGMTDLVIDYETTRPDLRPYSEEMMGGSPEQVPQRYYERSPIHFVNRIKAKLLIVQGMQDPNVTPENVSQVRSELEKSGIEYDLLTFEDEGHGIFRPKNLRVLYLRLAEFFEEAFKNWSIR